MLYIPKIKLDQTSQSIYIFQTKSYPETELRKYQVCVLLIYQKLGCAFFKKTEYSIKEIVFLIFIPNESSSTQYLNIFSSSYIILFIENLFIYLFIDKDMLVFVYAFP